MKLFICTAQLSHIFTHYLEHTTVPRACPASLDRLLRKGRTQGFCNSKMSFSAEDAAASPVQGRRCCTAALVCSVSLSLPRDVTLPQTPSNNPDGFSHLQWLCTALPNRGWISDLSDTFPFKWLQGKTLYASRTCLLARGARKGGTSGCSSNHQLSQQLLQP